MGHNPERYNQDKILFGRFKVLNFIGRGSIGAVYECSNIQASGKRVALKVLNPKAAKDERFMSAFKNEIQSSYRISSPNVVKSTEFFNDGNSCGICMEYVDGPDLAKLIEQNGIIPIEDTVEILKQLCQGVAAIHQCGIIHQDLKPQNILISKQGIVKITDFSASKVGFTKRTGDNYDITGTVEILSPEAILHGNIDKRTDIYAIGVVAYLLVTGEIPFYNPDMMAQFSSKIYGKIIAPEIINRDCPYALSQIILRALRKNPERRYASALEIWDDLNNIDYKLKPGIFKSILNFAGIPTLN